MEKDDKVAIEVAIGPTAGKLTHHAGMRRLALSVIKDALHQWNKNKSAEAKEFLEGDMHPFVEAAGLDLEDVQLRRALRKNGLVPFGNVPAVQ